MPTSRPSIAEVRAVAQAGIIERRSAEHWAGRWYMRTVSGHVTRWLVSTPAMNRVTPNALTLLMIALGLLAAAMVALWATWWAALIALVLIQAYLLLDCVDGEVARWRRVSSARGVYLDRLGHHVVEGALVVALGLRAAGGLWGTGLDTPASWWSVLGAVAALLVVLGKLETDLVVVARAGAGLPVDADSDPVSQVGSVRRLRRVFALLPLHRLIGAIELTLLLVVAAALDAVRADLLATHVLLSATAGVALLVAIGHPVTIMTSQRLR